MRSMIINNSLNLIKNNNEYDEIKLAEIKYGLETIYILITKISILLVIGFSIGILKELLILMFFYNIIKIPSFGLHAATSTTCLIISTAAFLLASYLAITIELNNMLISFICIICIVQLFKNAPADTHKRPIINKKRREIYKFATTIISITFSIIALLSTNSLLTNVLVFSLILQVITTAPTTYKLFNMPYNNYKNFI